MIQLPNKLSDLLELSVKDAQKCEAMPDKYALDMSDWARFKPHSIKPTICYVCMAGSVMVQSLGLNPSIVHRLDPWQVKEAGIKNAMLAIDSMRAGDFVDALYEFSGGYDNGAQLAALHECSLAVDIARDDLGDDCGPADRADWDTYLRCVAILRKVEL